VLLFVILLQSSLISLINGNGTVNKIFIMLHLAGKARVSSPAVVCKRQGFYCSGTQINTCKATSVKVVWDTDNSVSAPRQLIFFFQQWAEEGMGFLLNTV